MLNTFYVVHSKVNESVIQKTFNLLSEAIEYAKGDDDGKRDETYVEAVTADFDEYFNVDETDKKVVWSCDDESDTVIDTVTDSDIDLSEPDLESLEEHIQDRPAPIELKDNELEGQDNAVVPCKKYKVVAHCEDEKPVDCNMEKEVLPKRLTEDYQEEASKAIKEIVKRAVLSFDYDNSGTGDLDEIITQSIDDELIYSDDIIALARKYDILGSDGELIGKMYDELFPEVKAEVVKQLKERDYDLGESLKEDTSEREKKDYEMYKYKAAADRLLGNLRNMRLDEYAKDGYKVADITDEELYDLDDGDRLIEGIDIVLNALANIIHHPVEESLDNNFYDDESEDDLTEYLSKGLNESKLNESPTEDRIEEIKLISKQRPLTDDEVKEFAELLRQKK